MDAEASAHPELNKDQYEVETSYPKGPEYLDSDSSLIPEGTEHHEVIGAGDRDEEYTKKIQTMIRQCIQMLQIFI